jgi:hypothetical protein
MRRRDLLLLISGAVAALPQAARADRQRRVGFLSITSVDGMDSSQLAAVHRGLNETGYVEGRNLVIEYRWACYPTRTDGYRPYPRSPLGTYECFEKMKIKRKTATEVPERTVERTKVNMERLRAAKHRARSLACWCLSPRRRPGPISMSGRAEREKASSSGAMLPAPLPLQALLLTRRGSGRKIDRQFL